MQQTPSYQLVCPKCQGCQISSHGKRYALYPAGCLTVLALPLAWVHRASTPHDFECRSCGHRFARRTPAAKIAYAFLWITVAIVIWWMAMAVIQ
jgi:hypothetical protein